MSTRRLGRGVCSPNRRAWGALRGAGQGGWYRSGPSDAAVTRPGEGQMLATGLGRGKGCRKGKQGLGECALRGERGVQSLGKGWRLGVGRDGSWELKRTPGAERGRSHAVTPRACLGRSPSPELPPAQQGCQVPVPGASEGRNQQKDKPGWVRCYGEPQVKGL